MTNGSPQQMYKSYIDITNYDKDWGYTADRNGTVSLQFNIIETEEEKAVRHKREIENKDFAFAQLEKIDHFIEIVCAAKGFGSYSKLKRLFAEKEKWIQKYEYWRNK
jgi:hypothetical protein